MSETNKRILEAGNAAIVAGDHEGFLKYVADDTEWSFIGDQTLKGKEAVRRWMAATYVTPPTVVVDDLIAEGDLLTAIGEVTVTEPDQRTSRSRYCDVWRFRDGKLVELRAFVVKM